MEFVHIGYRLIFSSFYIQRLMEPSLRVFLIASSWYAICFQVIHETIRSGIFGFVAVSIRIVTANIRCLIIILLVKVNSFIFCEDWTGFMRTKMIQRLEFAYFIIIYIGLGRKLLIMLPRQWILVNVTSRCCLCRESIRCTLSNQIILINKWRNMNL